MVAIVAARANLTLPACACSSAARRCRYDKIGLPDVHLMPPVKPSAPPPLLDSPHMLELLSEAGIGLFRHGLWLLDYNGDVRLSGVPIDRIYGIGQAGDIPVTGDWSGDGRTKIGFFRNGMWLLDYNGNGGWDGTTIDRLCWLGQGGDTPLVGDWNGDGRKDIGFFRAGMWLLDYNGDGGWSGTSLDRLYWLGQAGDTPVTGVW